MAPVNYLGHIQLVEIRAQATNKTTAHLLYLHNVGEKLKIKNDVFIIPRIQHFNLFHSKHLTSTSDVSQNSRVTVVTDNLITLFYGLVLRRSFIHSPVNHQLIVTRQWPARDQQLHGPKHPSRLGLVNVQMNATIYMRLISGTLVLHLFHDCQFSLTLNHLPWEGRPPQPSWWRKQLLVTAGQFTLIYFTHHHSDCHPGINHGKILIQQTSQISGGKTGIRLPWSTPT